MHQSEIERFLSEMRAWIVASDAGLSELFDVYANEARFALRLIESDLSALPIHARVVEIGAGALILSAYLIARDYVVTSLEPVGMGFTQLARLQAGVRDYCREADVKLKVISATIENFIEEEQFDYAVSINVFEHIADIDAGLTRAYMCLKRGGKLRFLCPNYRFPYEPHFNIPTLWSKRLTGFVFRRWIADSRRVLEPIPMWNSLNWINVRRVRRLFRERFCIDPSFRRDATLRMVERTAFDAEFRRRRGALVSVALRILAASGGLRLLNLFPVSVSPVIDCTVIRPV